MHPGSASDEPGLLKTVKLIPCDKNRVKAVEPVKKEKNYSLPRSNDIVLRISTATREPKIKVETGKLGGKTDLHPVDLSLTGDKGDARKFESFSRCLNALTGEYDTDIGQGVGVQDNTELEKKDIKIDNCNSGNTPFTFTSDNFSATNNNEADECTESGEQENSKRTRANVDKISCTEIERLRILQLLREHDMKSRLKEEARVMEERRRNKKLLSQSQSHSTLHAVPFYPKKRIPFSGFNHAPPPIEKPLKAIPKYPPAPGYSKTECVSFLHHSPHRDKKEENYKSNKKEMPNLTDSLIKNENSIENLRNNLNSEINESESVTSKNDFAFYSALTTARTISVDTARTDNAAPVRSDTVTTPADNVPVPIPVPPAVSEPYYTTAGSSTVTVSRSGSGSSTITGVSTCISANVNAPATPVAVEFARYGSYRIVSCRVVSHRIVSCRVV
jgi:hypothetical protein